ncbi:hypothetical protein [Flavobacterium hydrophilum]|uniref:Uncharacterized protein n=1 Tax=Flavobacterium hydrophilum TaxID=2211445 RepID=A0A2V4C6C4_9FLAO|nr:hypothetical protein [Flavobacterium hydrophilum]PXY46916.1 hypothetical protein DMB68_07155 [Flavobacterium hydrophilum]
MKRILFLYCVISPVLSFSQAFNYNSKVSFAIETYAFLKGQNTALQKIAVQFPQLKPNVTVAEKNLKTVFGRAEKNLKQFLKEELNHKQYNSLQNYLDSLLHHQFPNQIEKEKYAHDFLLKVQERSNNINNEMLSKGILSFKYHDAPHQEITDGHVDFFTTENHPKAEETSLTIPIPKSWLAEEAEMPQTIQQFTSYYGNGNEKILIVVYDLPEELQGIKLTEKSIASILPPNTKLFRSEAVTIDGLPALMIEVEESLQYHKDSMKVRMLQFMLVQNQKLYCLQGSIGPEEAHEDLELQIEKFEPLFRLIASRAELDE